jgi:hypothetical protein
MGKTLKYRVAAIAWNYEMNGIKTITLFTYFIDIIIKKTHVD